MVGESRPPSESDLSGLPGYHPYNAQPWLVSVASGATALGIASVILRLLARRLNSMSWWWDDWMVAFSGVSPTPILAHSLGPRNVLVLTGGDDL